MSPRRVKPVKGSRGTPAWILTELRSLRPDGRLSTSQLAKRIGRTRGKKYHRNSIYNALRMLVRRGDARMTKVGRQKFYQLASGAGRRRPTLRAARPAGTKSAPPAGSAAALPHKLALGEILVLRATEEHVVSAANRKGRLVLKRHPLPK